MKRTAVVAATAVAGGVLAMAHAPARPLPELVAVTSGSLTLRAQIWRPAGKGRFPAVLFNHGSYGEGDPLPASAPETFGAVFARHGYVFAWLHRQGIGLSSGQGVADGDQMARAQSAGGADARNRVQIQLLEHDELDEASAALAQLVARRDVDATRIGVVGHSFGGSLSLLLAARHPEIRAAVIFGGAAGSWNQSAVLREHLLAAVSRMSAPALFMHAENDYSTASGRALAAEMERRGRPQTLKIYPPFGADARAGHNFLFQSVPTWETDVFAFLDRHLGYHHAP